MPHASESKIQKTIRLPLSLIHEAERFINACGHCESINEFIVKSMRLRIYVLKRRELDAKFAEMSEDADYQKEANLMAEEFEISDWEAAKLLED
jgi:hypothetical protein